MAVVREAERGPAESTAAGDLVPGAAIAGDPEAKIVGGRGVRIERDQGVGIASDRGAVITRDRGAMRDDQGVAIGRDPETRSARSGLGAVIATDTKEAGGIDHGAEDARGRRATA